MFKDDVDMEKIQFMLKEYNKKYDFSSEKEIYEKIKNSGNSSLAEQILEKYVILGFLVDNYHRNFIDCGVNPFQVTIFKDLF